MRKYQPTEAQKEALEHETGYGSVLKSTRMDGRILIATFGIAGMSGGTSTIKIISPNGKVTVPR